MAARATWKGYLKFSLVSCPVRLFNATSSSERVSFNLLHKDTKNRIQMKPVDPELGMIERSDLVKGYEFEKGRYVVLEDSDFEKVKIESTETINIESFVDAEEIDRVYFDSPYYLAPDGAMAEETFTVLREAMVKAGKTALGRVVLSSREHVVTIDPRDRGMLLTTLRNPREVRGDTAYFEGIPSKKADGEMLKLALQLIEQKTAKFEPESYTDRYETALLELIKAKIAGQEPVFASAPERGQVINLMDALKKSLEKPKPPAQSKARKKESAAGPKKKRA